MVKKEKAFQQEEAVITAVGRLHILAKMLDEHIETMDKHRGAVKAISHQLAHGTSEQQALAKILDHLVRGKQNLELQITLVQVGLIRKTRDAVDINTKIVQRIDRAVQQALGPGNCLAIARFVKAKLKESPNADGMLHLTWAEYNAFEQELIAEPPAFQRSAAETGAMQRFSTNNICDEDAFQLNAPIEVDLWENMDVKIDGCVATGRAIQTNYVQDRQTFKDLIRARTESIALQQRGNTSL